MLFTNKVYELESNAEQVDGVVSQINSQVTEAGLSKDEGFLLSGCVAELLNNIIEHAYEGKPGMPVRITINISHGWINVKSVDQGKPYPVGLRSRLSDEAAEDGRGIHIIDAWSETHRYMQTKEGNKHTLRRRVEASDD